jgi:exopolysaccharide production protein ExoQ
MTKAIPILDCCMVGCFLFLGIAGAIPGIAPNQASEMTGVSGSALQLVVGIGSQMCIDLFLLWFVLTHRLWLWSARGPGLGSLVFAGWAILSCMWSQSPWLTVRHAVPFALATAFALSAVEVYAIDRLLKLLTIAFAILAIWSIALAVGFPAIGLDASSGHTADWQGAFSQKNACGRAMVFALATLFAARVGGAARVCLGLMFVGVLVMSGSRGAWVIAAVILVLFVSLRLLEQVTREVRLLGCMAMAVCATGAVAYVALNFAAFAPLLGRDSTLTGRTAIWHQVWVAIVQRPLCGYGFSAFWQGTSGACWNVVVALGFVLFHAHNGFLEILLEVGAVGLLMVAASLLRGAVLAVRLMGGASLDAVLWPALMLALIVLYDLEENTLLAFNGLYWVLYVAALARLEKALAARQVRVDRQAETSMVSARMSGELSQAGVTPWL